MQRLLTLLDDPLAEGLEAEWNRCRTAGAELERVLAGAKELEADSRAELRAGLDRLMRLNAIARQSLQRGQEQLAKELTRTRAGSAQMKAYSQGAGPVGGSCNMAG